MPHPSRVAASTPAPWLPDAWGGAIERPTHSSHPTPIIDDGAFVAGWDVSAWDTDAGATTVDHTSSGATASLDALLPDFGAASDAAGRTAPGERPGEAAVARAADARESQVRAELDAAYAADLAAREAAHADALDQAWAEGHAAGCVAGESAAHEAFADAARVLDAAVHEVRTHEDRWMGDLRAHVAALAVAVAHHVVGREVAADDALVVALTARAVAEFPAQEALVARVHPADLGALKAAWESAPREGALRWAPDARMARGGALVEGRERIVDGRVDAALERLYRALAGHVA